MPFIRLVAFLEHLSEILYEKGAEKRKFGEHTPVPGVAPGVCAGHESRFAQRQITQTIAIIAKITARRSPASSLLPCPAGRLTITREDAYAPRSRRQGE